MRIEVDLALQYLSVLAIQSKRWRPGSMQRCTEKRSAMVDRRSGTKPQMQSLTRDLALFNLAIDSKLRGCDVVAVRVDDIAPSGYALDLATVRQKKTGKVSAVRADGANAAGHRVSEANRLEAGELPVSWSTRCVAGHDHPSTPGLFESWGEHRT